MPPSKDGLVQIYLDKYTYTRYSMMINTTSSNSNYTLLPQEVEQRTKKYKSILRKSKVAPQSYSNQILCNHTSKSKPAHVLAEAQPYGGLSVESLLWLNASLRDIRVAKKRLSTSLKLENTSSILISMKRITPLANKKVNTNRRSFAAA